GVPLPSGAQCAQKIPSEPEIVPDNIVPNSTVPTSAEITSYIAGGGYTRGVYKGRVDGQYQGTTDMIIRWAACKWGVDEDVIRAQGNNEHWSWDPLDAMGDKRTSYAQCHNGSFTDLWNYQCVNCCYQSWSIWQTKVYYAPQTWPMMYDSTSFAADYRYADQRICMDGKLATYFSNRPGYNGHTYSADCPSGNLDTMLWGCVGAHYSGNWYDDGAIAYIDTVKGLLSSKSWKTRWPFINWLE